MTETSKLTGGSHMALINVQTCKDNGESQDQRWGFVTWWRKATIDSELLVQVD
jgi:hypothetical protein